MADEHTLQFETALAIPMTVGDTTGLERGALLQMYSPMTASGTLTVNGVCAGVVAEEKIASDGKTMAPIYREGYFRAIASGSITMGDGLIMAGPANPNQLMSAPSSDTVSGQNIVGLALEDATTTSGFIYQLKPIINTSGV